MAHLNPYGKKRFSQSKRSKAVTRLHKIIKYSDWCKLSKSKQNNLIRLEMKNLSRENKKNRRKSKKICKHELEKYAA